METQYDVYKALEQLSELRAQAEIIRLNYENVRKSIIPAEIQARLDEAEMLYFAERDNLHETMDLLENRIKSEIMELENDTKTK